jgi:hypothetical protein
MFTLVPLAIYGPWMSLTRFAPGTFVSVGIDSILNAFCFGREFARPETPPWTCLGPRNRVSSLSNYSTNSAHQVELLLPGPEVAIPVKKAIALLLKTILYE